MDKKKKKITIAIMVASLVAVLTIGGIIAFFTDNDSALHRFSTVSAGAVTIEEPNWNNDTDGKNLIPSVQRVKDPTAIVEESSGYVRFVVRFIENGDGPDGKGNVITNVSRNALIMETLYYDSSYDADGTPVTSIIDVDRSPGYSLAELAGLSLPHFNPSTVTIPGPVTKPATGVYYYACKNTVTNDVFSEGDEIPLFTNIVIPSDWGQTEQSMLGEYLIEIYAEMVYAETFANAEAAFAALDA